MNNEFGIVIRESKAVISSRDVARVYEKPHRRLAEIFPSPPTSTTRTGKCRRSSCRGTAFLSLQWGLRE